MFKKFVMSLFVAGLLIAAPKADAHSSIDNLRAAACQKFFLNVNF